MSNCDNLLKENSRNKIVFEKCLNLDDNSRYNREKSVDNNKINKESKSKIKL